MNELMHYGVLGMKWGHHKVRDASNKKKTEWNKNYSKSDRNIDTMIFGKSGVKRINKRMNKGQSYLKAESIEAGQYMVKSSLLTIGTMDVLTGGQLHRAVGKVVVDKYMKSKAAKSVIKIAQNHKFDPIDVPFKIVN